MTEQTNHSTVNQTHSSIWRSKHIVKKDFWLIPIYLIASNVIPIILFALVFGISFSFNHNRKILISEESILIIGSVFAEIIILLSFYGMHIREHLIPIALKRIRAVRKYILIIVLTYIAILGMISLYDWLIQFLPPSLQYSETQNQQLLEKMFENKLMLPILFIDIVILTPIIEELLFRHLIIHELGKKITYTVATILSVILFAGAHMLSASSPFEMGSYIIIAVGLAFVYIKSGMNLAVSISLHILNNLISFIGIVLTQ
ncbi:CPBP family intramembrane glutamic endopeptidase [Staphylococcus caeli]|uniref:CPBP family intramembrane glutamic endopeptidase n=1 Tax=Staphylococcus caeli TaxID=2201815 RepID=UPI003F565208